MSAVDNTKEHLSNRINRLNLTVLILGFLVFLLDGYDIYTLAYAAPHILQDWHIADKALLGPVFSAALVGMLLGAPLSGYLGDRFGRRITVISCCALIGIPTLMVLSANSLTELIVWRAIAGIGFGGLNPALISLISEYAPTRLRAVMISTMYAGVTVGAASAGAVGTWLVPLADWHLLFLIGGIGALLAGIICIFALPESLSFLLVKNRLPKHLLKYVRKDQLQEKKVSQSKAETSGLSSFRKQLFKDKLALLTPLLWVLTISIIMTFGAITNWLPTLLSSVGRFPSSAASFGMVFLIGGTLGGLFLSWLIDRGYIIAIAWAFVASVPLVVLISVTAHSDLLLYVSVFLSGFSIQSIQFGVSAVASTVYPTQIRSSALGCYFFITRIGNVI